MPYVEVAVDTPTGRPSYSYHVPEGMDVCPGQLVWVPFGSRTVRGIVLTVSPNPAHEATRDVLRTEVSFVLSQRQRDLAAFISTRYASPLFSALALFLPPGIERRPAVSFEAAELSRDSLAALSHPEAKIVAFVQQSGAVPLSRLRQFGRGSTLRRTLDSLVSRGILLRRETPGERGTTPRLQTVVTLSLGSEAIDSAVASLERGRAHRLAAILRYLAAVGGTAADVALRQEAGATAAALRTLERRGLVTLSQRRIWRETLSSRLPVAATPLELNEAQSRALECITSDLAAGRHSEQLLFGVTGSGKTELYLRAARCALDQGRGVICLVPEIALAAQTVERFVSRFPGRVALLHSGLTSGQQFDEWERVREGRADVVIGPRSALFAPLRQPGLIVLDEEHEWTYKQDDVAPRYHARDVARELACREGAVLLLGSATPDVGTFFRAMREEARLLQLPQRVREGTRLPLVEVVDMREELRAGNTAIFSRALRTAIAETLARGEQALLFLNRRGSATLVQCRRCGYVFTCRRCAVALAYHEARQTLLCHRCGYTVRVPERCPECRSPRLRYIGAGTQRVVQDVGLGFPGVKVVRWDSDVPAGVRGGSALQDAVHSGHVDVIVGTQMVAKGHDFSNVTLVGVMNADVGLTVPDFRSSERVFQLISQASGRAGRGVKPGRVIVQTYEPDSHVVRSAAAHDYRAFYAEEIRYREQSWYPPFSRLVKLLYAHVNEEKCRHEAERVHALLRQRCAGTDYRITGPAPAFLRRLRGHYRWQLTVRGTCPLELLRDLDLPRGWLVDVDPASVA